MEVHYFGGLLVVGRCCEAVGCATGAVRSRVRACPVAGLLIGDVGQRAAESLAAQVELGDGDWLAVVTQAGVGQVRSAHEAVQEAIAYCHIEPPELKEGPAEG
jgi:hypothetical protein